MRGGDGRIKRGVKRDAVGLSLIPRVAAFSFFFSLSNQVMGEGLRGLRWYKEGVTGGRRGRGVYMVEII